MTKCSKAATFVSRSESENSKTGSIGPECYAKSHCHLSGVMGIVFGNLEGIIEQEEGVTDKYSLSFSQ